MEALTKPKVKMERGSRRIYKTSDGVKVPGVTTILSVISKPQLMPWCAKEERDGIIEFICKNNYIEHRNVLRNLPSKYYYETKRDNAASVGTICHFMCESYLKGLQPHELDLSEFPKEQVSLAENGFIKFLEFWEKSGLKIVHTEYPLVHSELNYGGTLDCVCEDQDGKIVLLDLKTSKALYPEMFGQIAAYKELWNYTTYLRKDGVIKRNIIIRIGKTEANDLEVREENSLKPYMDLFMGALAVYNAQKDIKDL